MHASDVCSKSISVGFLFASPCSDAKGLSAGAVDKVAQVQKQLLNMLQSTSATFPSDRHRFPLMLLRLRNIKSISIDVVQHMEVHRTIGDAHLDRIFVELMDMSS